jgi:phospholipase/carboxylesterase
MPCADASIELIPDSYIKQLFILLHGVGQNPQKMMSLADAVRTAFPQAAILIPAGFDSYDNGAEGRQWFSIRAVSEENRVQRVAAAMPGLLALVRAAQKRFGLLGPETALAGFSQGAIMALEATQAEESVAGRVLAFAGRYASLPTRVAELCTIHLLHGTEDRVIPVVQAEAAQARLRDLNADATIDIATKVGHELHPVLIERAILRLQTCVPLRSWETALGLNQCAPSDVTLH